VPCHRRSGARSLAFLPDGRGLVAQKRQLRVDDFLEFGLRLCAAQKHAIDEESGSTSDPVLFTLLHIGFDLRFEFAAVEARLKRFLIEIQCSRVREQIGAFQFGLIRVQRIMILQNFPCSPAHRAASAAFCASGWISPKGKSK